MALRAMGWELLQTRWAQRLLRGGDSRAESRMMELAVTLKRKKGLASTLKIIVPRASLGRKNRASCITSPLII